jgi:hypothetical protein
MVRLDLSEIKTTTASSPKQALKSLNQIYYSGETRLEWRANAAGWILNENAMGQKGAQEAQTVGNLRDFEFLLCFLVGSVFMSLARPPE